MAKRKRGGRPRKPGERKPCGKLKRSTVEPLSGALWQRLRRYGQKIGADPRLTTELGRLNWFGELTSVQVAAGLRVGQVYRRYERLNQLLRSPRSPSYESGFGDPDIAEDRLSPDQLLDLEEDHRDAYKEWLELDKNLIPSDLRSPVQELCVQDESINPILLTRIRALLDRLAAYWSITTKDKTKTTQTQTTPSSGASLKRLNIDRMCWIDVLQRAFPYLSEKQISHLINTQRALVDRHRFREQKQSKLATRALPPR